MSTPISVALDGRRGLVVGSGGAAVVAVSRLQDSGVLVSVLAPGEPTPALLDLAARGSISLTGLSRDAVATIDVTGYAVVAARTDDRALDQAVESLAAAAGIATLPTGSGPDVVVASEDDPHPHGSVTIVGGGPGDAGLLTVAGQQALAAADVVVADRLAPLAALEDLPHRPEIIDAAKVPHGPGMSQESINALLIEHARAGRRVVRLKGGDPFVFGRGMEEVLACGAADVAVRVIPGVTSAVSVPAMAGIPLTHRGLTQGFVVVSGHVPPGHPDSQIDWTALARSGVTLVLLMAVGTLPKIADVLLAGGLPADTPVATVMNGSRPDARTVRTRLDAVERLVDDIRPPAVTVIGAVAAESLS